MGTPGNGARVTTRQRRFETVSQGCVTVHRDAKLLGFRASSSDRVPAFLGMHAPCLLVRALPSFVAFDWHFGTHGVHLESFLLLTSVSPTHMNVERSIVAN